MSRESYYCYIHEASIVLNNNKRNLLINFRCVDDPYIETRVVIGLEDTASKAKSRTMLKKAMTELVAITTAGGVNIKAEKNVQFNDLPRYLYMCSDIKITLKKPFTRERIETNIVAHYGKGSGRFEGFDTNLLTQVADDDVLANILMEILK